VAIMPDYYRPEVCGVGSCTLQTQAFCMFSAIFVVLKFEKISVLRFFLHVLALIGCLKAVGLKINRNNRAATGICSIRNNLGKLGHRLTRCGKII
jgi:hypothetical protein